MTGDPGPLTAVVDLAGEQTSRPSRAGAGRPRARAGGIPATADFALPYERLYGVDEPTGAPGGPARVHAVRGQAVLGLPAG
ncbi:hypothetical protein ACIP39_14660 [Streptomyces tibetensis]|uniref:hypothetical protein n=1 Tax=Streptomyces tibetensis TaxID=2382123 RepID=UPI003803DF3B